MTASDLAFLIAPGLAFVIAAGSPGPATLAVAATSMGSGRQSGVALGLGLAVGLLFWGLLTALGFGALVLNWTPAMTILRIAGGAYLLFLAWKSARSALDPGTRSPHAITGRSPMAMFRRGVLLNVTNPKAVLAWTAVIAIGLPAGAGSAELAAIVLTCTLLGFVVNVGYAFVFSMATVMRGYARARQWIDGVFSLLFAGAGLKLIFSRVDAP